MALESIQVSAVLPAIPLDVYDAWLDGGRHGAMTGGSATVEPKVGGRHTAWDGYIEGTTLELEPGRRIVQSWRSLDFPAGAGDSRIEILLRAVDGGTEITLHHSEIPEGQGSEYEQGWIEHYFRPMVEYFSEAKDQTPSERTQASLPSLGSESVGAARSATELTVIDGLPTIDSIGADTQLESATALANGVGELRVISEEALFAAEPTPAQRPAPRVRPQVSLSRKTATSAKSKVKVKAKAATRKTAVTIKAKSKSKRKVAKKRPAAPPKKKLATKRKVVPKKPTKKPAGKATRRGLKSKARARRQ